MVMNSSHHAKEARLRKMHNIKVVNPHLEKLKKSSHVHMYEGTKKTKKTK